MFDNMHQIYLEMNQLPSGNPSNSNLHQQGKQQLGQQAIADNVDKQIQEALHNPSNSDWLKAALSSLLKRDIVDAYSDVGVLNHLIGVKYKQHYQRVKSGQQQ
jgi:hypothetical protein